MFRKLLISLLFAGIVVVIGNITIVAQFGPAGGRVELKKADGTTEPVPGAVVEVYRTDIKNTFPSGKTNKKGEFIFAGIPFGGVFVISVSAPNISPMIFPNVRAGDDKIVITVYTGDGRKLTEAEVRSAAATSGTTPTAEMTAEDKKRQAEYAAKVAEISAKNEKSKKTNEIVATATKEGGDAFNAKNYDLAITKYSEGIAADPDFVGSAPSLLDNRSISLVARATDTYNRSIKLTDPTEKIAGLTKAREDLAEAAKGYLQAWNVLKNAPATDISDKASFEAIKAITLARARDAFRVAVKTEQVDPAAIEAAKVLIPEYAAAEKDPAKKAEASLIFADLYRVTGDSDNAVAEYKKILATSPNDPDALAGAGLSLVNLGFINNDKAKLQEGADMLQQFVSIAPDTHRLKASAADSIKYLKEQNITPVKGPAGKKKGT
ncbi:MAG TPA: hypothetical protein VGO43_06425 [Pyrinomonadaceae bacterium]|jgi:tetratricopeptide (TPR) repeat protein|nr:hypothetical protein [Pyrinomonadaceae bacterium]